jgi:hypothetical protein
MNSYTGLDETIQIIENITSGQLMEAANEILSTERLSSLIFQS